MSPMNCHTGTLRSRATGRRSRLEHERPARLLVGEELALAREIDDGVAGVHVGHDRVVPGDERHQHRDERMEAEPLGDGHGDESDDGRCRHPRHEKVEHEGDDRDGQNESVGVPDHGGHPALHQRGQPGVDVEGREHVAEAQDHPAIDQESERPATLEGRLVEGAQSEQEQEGDQREPRRRDTVVRTACEADDQEDQHHGAPDLVPGQGSEERLLELYRLEVDPAGPVRFEADEQKEVHADADDDEWRQCDEEPAPPRDLVLGRGREQVVHDEAGERPGLEQLAHLEEREERHEPHGGRTRASAPRSPSRPRGRAQWERRGRSAWNHSRAPRSSRRPSGTGRRSAG